MVDPKKYDPVPNTLFGGKKLDLVCTRINKNGEKEKVLLFNYGNPAFNQLAVTPVKLQWLNNNEFIGSGMVKGRKEVLVRFTVR